MKTEKKGGRTYYFFICSECGAEFSRRSDYVKKMSGRCTKCANEKAGVKRSSHGFNNSNSRLHVTWANMKRRCLNPTHKEKKNYNLISLCKDWNEFEPFMEWALLNGYGPRKTIDRKDNCKGYCPGNCRFVNVSTQNANKRITNKNTTGYIGVTKSRCNKWISKIQWRKKQIHIGTFDTKIKAAEARDRYIIKNNLPHTLSLTTG